MKKETKMHSKHSENHLRNPRNTSRHSKSYQRDLNATSNQDFHTKRSNPYAAPTSRKNDNSHAEKDHKYQRRGEGRGRKRSRSKSPKINKLVRRRSRSRSGTVRRSENDSSGDERKVVATNDNNYFKGRQERVYSNRSTSTYKKGAERSQRRLAERETRKKATEQIQTSKNQNQPTQPRMITTQQPQSQFRKTDQQETLPANALIFTEQQATQNQPINLTTEQSQTILNWSIAKTNLENESLKREIEIKDQTIIKLSKENIEFQAREVMYQKQLREAEARAARAELAAEENTKEANETIYRKLYFTQMANLRSFIHLSDEMMQEAFENEVKTNEYHASVKYHSNSIYLKGDKRIPIENLKKWAEDPDVTLNRKSHKRGFKFIPTQDEGKNKNTLIKVKDKSSEGLLVGEYNWEE